MSGELFRPACGAVSPRITAQDLGPSYLIPVGKGAESGQPPYSVQAATLEREPSVSRGLDVVTRSLESRFLILNLQIFYRYVSYPTFKKKITVLSQPNTPVDRILSASFQPVVRGADWPVLGCSSMQGLPGQASFWADPSARQRGSSYVTWNPGGSSSSPGFPPGGSAELVSVEGPV